MTTEELTATSHAQTDAFESHEEDNGSLLTFEIIIGEKRVEFYVHLSIVPHMSEPLIAAMRNRKIVNAIRAELEQLVSGVKGKMLRITSFGPGRPEANRNRRGGNSMGYIEYGLLAYNENDPSTQLSYAHSYSTISGSNGRKIQKYDPQSTIDTYCLGLRKALTKWQQELQSDS